MPGTRSGSAGKEEAAAKHAALLAELAELQERLYAESKRSILLVLQGLDASGKDGTIKHVFTGLNPQGCRVSSFKAPTPVELAHDFLWRVHAQCPERGMIGIFNRSHYEDIVTVRVLGLVPPAVWKARAQRVNEFEELLAGDGTTVLKCFLHVSQEEQAARLAERVSDPTKEWKSNPKDLETNKRFDDFTAAYEDALAATSTKSAPWYVIPADRNWVRNFAVTTVLIHALRKLDPQFPVLSRLAGFHASGIDWGGVTKVLAVRAPSHDQGEFVLSSLHDAVEKKRIELDDIALVSHDADGKLELHKTSGRFHRHRIDDAVLRHVGDQIEFPDAMVLAQGDDDTIDRVGQRVRAITGGDMKTYEVAGDELLELREVTGTDGSIALADDEGLLREASDSLAMPTGIMVKMPLS